MNHSTIARTLTMGFRLFAASLLVLLAGLLAIPQLVRADSYVVENSDNDGTGSLRWAIDQANGNSGPDTITFATSTNGNPIVLAGTVGEDANAGGDLDILDRDDLTILGNGSENTLIDGGGIDRVFHVCPGGGCDSTVTFTDVTIRNGSADSPNYGGGIYNEAGTTILLGSTVSDNAADDGGGIYNKGGTTTVDGSSVSANTAVTGGGIYNLARLMVRNGSRVSANTAVTGGGIYNLLKLTVQNGSITGGTGASNRTPWAGGIYNWGGTMTVTGSTVSDNTADEGGGIYNWGGTTTVTGSAVSANKATGNGGGIYNLTSNMTVIGSTISDNTAVHGGGIYNEIGGTTTVDGSTVSGNTADRGGGIYNESGGTTMVDGSIVNANTAEDHGGGIYNGSYGRTMVDGSTVRANTADRGGGIYNEATLSIQNGSAVNANMAVQGGGINNIDGTTTLVGSSVSDNTADYGGGISNYDGILNILYGSIIGEADAGNMAGQRGGGIYNMASGATTVDGSSISANTATWGGGIYNGGTLNVRNSSTIGGADAGNTATWGGGIYNWGVSTTVTGSRILNNAADEGGGVFNNKDAVGSTSVTSSCITGNSAYSFFSARAAKQIATGNWWGAPAGSNTLGADTSGGSVDVTGHLTEPILGCGVYVFQTYLPLMLK